MGTEAENIINQLTAYYWIAILVVIVLAIVGLANFVEALRKLYEFGRDVIAHFKGKRMSDADLQAQAITTAKQLMDFAQTRQACEPQFDFDNFHESSNLQIKHSRETQNSYARDFAGMIANFRDEFLKRGLHDKDLDSFYHHPTNYIGLKIVAIRIASLAEKLRG